MIKSEIFDVFMNLKSDFVSEKSVTACEQNLGYSFKNKELLKAALTHRSCSTDLERNYERLEFLGDSILGFVVAEHLFLVHVGKEGILTAEKQRLVSTEPLATAAKMLKLDEYIALSKDLRQNGFASGIPNTVLENVYEAIIAAIYLDSGLTECKTFIQKTLLINEKNSLKTKNYIAELQEYAQANKLGTPVYETVSQIGPSHEPSFKMAVVINGEQIALGVGGSKKIANRQAAKLALKKLRKGKAK